ncbi:methyl-CpG-binding domain-containing protein [Ancistrocladus abbreviatus]
MQSGSEPHKTQTISSWQSTISPMTSPSQLQLMKLPEKGKTFDPTQMQLAPATAAARTFELPDGWVVEVRPRGPNSSIKADKYYYEPETGRQFRSLLSIQRYLNGGEDMPMLKRNRCCSVNPMHVRNSGPLRRIVYAGKIWGMDELEACHGNIEDMVPSTAQHKLSSILPDGWIVEEVPRKTGFRSDRYYIEPVSRQKFRSLLEVQRYLAGELYKQKRKALKLIKHSAPQSSGSWTRNTQLEIIRPSSSNTTNAPERVNWVFSGSGEDTWNPFIGESVIPDHIKELWAETFMLGMTGNKHQVPQLTMKEGEWAI